MDNKLIAQYTSKYNFLQREEKIDGFFYIILRVIYLDTRFIYRALLLILLFVLFLFSRSKSGGGGFIYTMPPVIAVSCHWDARKRVGGLH